MNPSEVDIKTLYDLVYMRVHGQPITRMPRFYSPLFPEIADMIINELRPLTQEEKDERNAQFRKELEEMGFNFEKQS